MIKIIIRVAILVCNAKTGTVTNMQCTMVIFILNSPTKNQSYISTLQ